MTQSVTDSKVALYWTLVKEKECKQSIQIKMIEIGELVPPRVGDIAVKSTIQLTFLQEASVHLNPKGNRTCGYTDYQSHYCWRMPQCKGTWCTYQRGALMRWRPRIDLKGQHSIYLAPMWRLQWSQEDSLSMCNCARVKFHQPHPKNQTLSQIKAIVSQLQMLMQAWHTGSASHNKPCHRQKGSSYEVSNLDCTRVVTDFGGVVAD